MEDSLSQEFTQILRRSIEHENNPEEEDENVGYWGRLYPARRTVKHHDLTKDEIMVGKLKSCDVCLKPDEVPSSTWAVVSRQHFCIIRIPVDHFGTTTYKVKLKDLSMNGTFVNGYLVGKNKMTSLVDKNVISVGKPQNEVYYYKDAQIHQRVPRLVSKKYDICTRLGTGAYGEVFLVFNKESGKSFAMKTILKGSKINKKKMDLEIQKLENEVKILRKIKHPNVIQLVDDIECHMEKYLLLELMEGKDLFQRIISNKRLTEPQSKLYFYQIAAGVQYLHQNGIIHRDLKPENILLASDESDTVLKITDFGLSKIKLSTTYLKSTCGTKMYAAPEVLLSRGTQKYTAQVDVWSMGVILFVCLSGETPFSVDKNGKTMDEQIQEGLYSMHSGAWENVSFTAKKLVRQMMTVNATKRITVPALFKDPWLQDSDMLSKVNSLVQYTSTQVDELPALQNKENTPHQGDGESLSSPSVITNGSPPSPRLPPVELMSTYSPRRKRLRTNYR